MLHTTRLILVASSLALVAPTAAFIVTGSASAQGAGDEGGGEAPKQITLTQKIIDSLIAAEPEMAALQAKDQGGNAGPDAKMQAKMDAIVKKSGFAGLADYEEAADTVGLVLAGMDPETKAYVGPAAIIKKQMAQVQADKTLPAKDKAQTLHEMKEALATAGSVKPLPGNADLVAKNYDKLSEGYQSGE